MLRIGLLGAGHLGKIHLRILKELPQFELVGFYDANQATAQLVSQEYQVPFFASMEELIGQVDVVDIVTPTIAHFECASKALKRSKHVFIEKPLTNTIEEAKILMQLAKEANVKVQVGHVERFNPAYLKAKDYCTNPLFIEGHRLAQFNPRGTDVSVVLDLMIHDIDIVLSLVHSNIKRISASGVAVVSESPDITNARIEFDNGCVANLTASRISLKNMRKTRFFQRDAYISMDLLDKKVEIVRLSQPTESDADNPFVIDLGEGKGKKKIDFQAMEVDPLNAIAEELKSFAVAITENQRPVVNIEDGFKALDLAHKIIDKIKHTSNFIEEPIA